MGARVVYLDHNATTPVDTRVLEAMWPWFTDQPGNAASRHHASGRRAEAAVEKAREQVAGSVGGDPREVVWTSGATEANNLALKGVMRSPVHASSRDHLVTVVTEHKAILDPTATLEAEGVRVTRLGVGTDGRVDLDQLSRVVDERTRLVSVMLANNETGVLQPIDEIARITRAAGALLHTDATQALGRLPLRLDDTGVDLASFSAHKSHGPKGVGALWLRRKGPRVRCVPLIEGGGHERGLRSGTLNVPGIVGFGRAAELAHLEGPGDAGRMAGLRDRLERGLIEIGGVTVNGAGAPRLPNTSSLAFEGVDAESLLRRLESVEASTSAACTSASLQPSYVLRAMGLDEASITGSVRLSLGRSTTREDIEIALEELLVSIGLERTEGPTPSCEV